MNPLLESAFIISANISLKNDVKWLIGSGQKVLGTLLRGVFAVKAKEDAEMRLVQSEASIQVIGPGWAEGHWQKLACRLGFLEAGGKMELGCLLGTDLYERKVKDWAE